MATLVATSPPPSLSMNGMFTSGHAQPSPAYSPPARVASPLTSVPMDELMGSPTLKPALEAPLSVVSASAVGQPNALVTPALGVDAPAPRRPAKDLAAFYSLLPPPVEFVEGSSSGTFASSLEGRYEPINTSPKAAPRSLSEAQTKVKPTSTKKSASEQKTPKPLYSRPIDLSWPPGAVRGSGLFNQGNTCFLNSALQCLLHTPPLLRVLNAHTKAECRVQSGFCMSCAMRQVMIDSFQKGRTFTPIPITRNLNYIAKHLKKGRQEDAHEFLRYAIDSLQKSCLAGHPSKIDPKLAETTWVHKIFGGRLRSRVTCQQCEYNSDTFDSILDLSIDINNMHGIKDALKKFTAKEYLKGPDKYKCERCKRPVNAEKQFTIHEAPAVLTIHLKRFTPLGRKLQHPVRYDERLSLQPAMSEGQHGPTYSLYGVISHMGGGPNSGHYFAHVRGSDGQWYEMNDESVERARRPEPLNMKSAYMLFYIRDKGEALQAALLSAGLVNSVATSRKRKDLSDDERNDARKDAQKEAGRPFIGPVIPAHLHQPKADLEAEKLKQKIDVVEREKKVKGMKMQNGVQRADSRPLRPLVDYDDDDEEKGEHVERTNVDMTRNNSHEIDTRKPRGDSGLPPSSSPTPNPTPGPGPGSSRRKELNGDIPNSDQVGEGASSPGQPPPTSPLQTSSPAEPIPPSNFYGSSISKSASSSKRKSPGGDASDVDMDTSNDRITQSAPRFKSRTKPIPIPIYSDHKRPLGRIGFGTPFGKSRLGNNLHTEKDREDEERELFRPRKKPNKQFGSRAKFSI